MAVRLRLTRVGGKKDPIWRVVAADQRSPRDGRVIETIGHYNAQTDPSTIALDEARVLEAAAEREAPVYLETTKAENVPYYGSFGFRVIDEHALPRGASP